VTQKQQEDVKMSFLQLIGWWVFSLVVWIIIGAIEEHSSGDGAKIVIPLWIFTGIFMLGIWLIKNK